MDLKPTPNRPLLLAECGHWFHLDSPPGALLHCPLCGVLVHGVDVPHWAEYGENCDADCGEEDCDQAHNDGVLELGRAVRKAIAADLSGELSQEMLDKVAAAIDRAEQNCC